MTNNRRLGVAFLQYSVISWLVLAALAIISLSFLSYSKAMIPLGLVTGASVSLLFRVYMADSETYGRREFPIALLSVFLGTSIMGLFGLALYLTGDQNIPNKEDKDLKKGLIGITTILVVSVALLSFIPQEKSIDRENALRGTTENSPQYQDNKQIEGFGQDIVIGDFVAKDGKLQIVIRNSQPSTIKLNSVAISNEGKHISTKANTKLSLGDTKTVEIEGIEDSETINRFNIEIDYIKELSSDTTDSRKATGKITGYFKLK